MKASLFALLPIAGLLMACVPAEPVPGPDAGVSCGADGLAGLVGQPESVLQTMRFSQPIRVIHPGTAVTMDYAPGRLNIDVGEDGRISRLWCG